MKILKKVNFSVSEHLTEFKKQRDALFGPEKFVKVPSKNPYYEVKFYRGRSKREFAIYKIHPLEWDAINLLHKYGQAVSVGEPLNKGYGDYSYFYIYQGEAYESEIKLSVEDITTIVNEERNSKIKKLHKELDRIKAKAEYEGKTRAPVSEDVQIAVWNRDGGKCVKCGSKENLEFDHVIPFSKGGSNTARNIQLLCQVCNRKKGANIGG